MNDFPTTIRGKLPQNFAKQQNASKTTAATTYNNDKSSNNYNKKHPKLKKSLSECENYSNNNTLMSGGPASVAQSAANHLQSPSSTAKRKKKDLHHPSQHQRQHSIELKSNYIPNASNNSNANNNNVINSNDLALDDNDDFRRFNSLRCDNKNKSQLNLYSIDRGLTASHQYLAYQQRMKDMKNDSNYDNFSSSSTSTDYRGTMKNSGSSMKPAVDTPNASKRMSKNGRMGTSSLSLCSCDADTEVIPNPMRPLYQYSLDRKKPRHTYTCEQNAQILMRLQSERGKKYGSANKLQFGTTTPTKTANIISNSNNIISSSNNNNSANLSNYKSDSIGFDYPGIFPESNFIENDPFIADNIPPPPPPLKRNPSFTHHCSTQTPVHSKHFGSSTALPSLVGGGSCPKPMGNEYKDNHCGNGILSANKPDLFNFTSHHHPQTQQDNQPIMSSLRQASVPTKSVSLSRRNSTQIDDEIPLQPLYTPYYYDDNYLPNHHQSHHPPYFSLSQSHNQQMQQQQPHHPKQPPPQQQQQQQLHHSQSSKQQQQFYDCNDDMTKINNDVGNKENESLFFYHHEPDTYLPNYEYDAQNVGGGGGVGIPGKFNTITAANPLSYSNANNHSFSKKSNSQLHKYHSSTCNLNQFNSSNLLNSNTNNNFSTSLTNFNFYPQHYHHHQQQQQQQQQMHQAPHKHGNPPYTQFYNPNGLSLGVGLHGGISSSSLIGGVGCEPFASNGSLGTPKQPIAAQHPWKHRQCSSRGSSSSTSSSSKWDLPSRQWLAVTSIILIAGAAGVAVPLALRVAAGAPLDERLQVATQFLDSVPLIDGHNDLPWNIRKFLHNQLNEFRFDEDLRTILPWSKSSWSHTDLLRLKQGRISAQFWAAYVPCEAQHKDAVQITLEQIDVINRLTEKYSPQLIACTSSKDIIEAHKNHQMCSLIGVEGGHSLGGSLGVLRIYYSLGVRYMTLTSTCHTPWADSSNADAPKFDVKHGGLTTYGKTVIKEMNRLGMVVDMSKTSIATMRAVLAITEAPVIFSHSSAYELCNSSRNVQDEILAAITKNGGLVMVNFYSKFLSCTENSTIYDAIAHINHIKRVAGIDHVGLGAGYDGINFTPIGLNDVSSYPMLFAELLGNGWSIEDLTKLAGQNMLRVLDAVEKVSAKQKEAKVKPFEEIPNFRTDDIFNCSTNS